MFRQFTPAPAPYFFPVDEVSRFAAPRRSSQLFNEHRVEPPSYPSYYPHPPVQAVSPAALAREKYLRALSELQEAEDELVVAKELEREELTLRRRLEEIEAQKQQSQYFRAAPRAPHRSQEDLYSIPAPRSRGVDLRQQRLDQLKREIEEEERRVQEEQEYEQLLRRKEAILRARDVSYANQDVPQPAQQRPQASPVNKVSSTGHKENQKPKTHSEPYVVFHTVTPSKAEVPKAKPQPQDRTTTMDPAEFFKALFKEVAVEQANKPEDPKPKSDIDSRLSKVQAIESTFYQLQQTFTFPTEVAWADVPASGTPISKLAYTVVNKPIREHEQSLNKLVAQLDEISSKGDEKLRLRRKEVVMMVEKAIQDLECEIERRWVDRKVAQPEAADSPESKSAEEPQVAVVNETMEYTPEASELVEGTQDGTDAEETSSSAALSQDINESTPSLANTSQTSEAASKTPLVMATVADDTSVPETQGEDTPAPQTVRQEEPAPSVDGAESVAPTTQIDQTTSTVTVGDESSIDQSPALPTSASSSPQILPTDIVDMGVESASDSSLNASSEDSEDDGSSTIHQPQSKSPQTRPLDQSQILGDVSSVEKRTKDDESDNDWSEVEA